MKHLTKLFKLLELTRAQPQYGYVAAGISKSELSDLAQHHYLVTVMAWQLARQLKSKGAKIDVEKVLEYSLIHDLGELFGGDIAMPYGRKNPVAKKLARAFEYENTKFLSAYFGSDQKHFLKLGLQVNESSDDESILCMIADIIECTHYKLYKGKLEKLDLVMAKEKIGKNIVKLQDKTAKKELGAFVKNWYKDLPQQNKLSELF